MKRRVKPFNELLRWQKNRRLRLIATGIDESDISENHDLKARNCTDLDVGSKEKIIEERQIENSLSDLNDTLYHSTRSFFKCVKNCNGYNGCERYTIREEYDDKVIFLDCNCERKTDYSFKNKLDPHHHIRVSPLEKLGIGMVRAFVLDYMNLVLLGVMKRLLLLWTKGIKECRISSRDYKILNERLRLNQEVPSEISRKLRSNLNKLTRWKATEFRFFLLYLAPFILYDLIPDNYIQHYSALHCAMRILCDPLNCVRNKNYAEKLLLWFVQNFRHLYGTENVVYCVHNLIHLADNVDTFGAPLDDIIYYTCFPFENEMKNIKKYLRKHDKPLSQIFRRILEKAITLSATHLKKNTYPLLINKSMTIYRVVIPFESDCFYKGIGFEKFTLRTTNPNNISYLKDGSIYLYI
ncbi:uncharacterized protein [Temnothorax longispinosus]|uniref:uncharacterized protein n=1 Tax=Temnothorax longispinosus TaxID=300112 RepID=UPI003A9922A8